MSSTEADFLDAIGRDFSSRADFISYIKSEVDLSKLDNKLSLIGSVSDHNRETFIDRLSNHFKLVNQNDDLLLLWASDERIPYYVHLEDNEFPIFFTAANKTDEIPDTLVEYLKKDHAMSRMWVGKREMERLRQQMVDQHRDLIIPQFTAKRSKHTDIPAKKRPEYNRTMRYWADDGLETYRHMKSRYGVLPTNIQFEVPGNFKFQITQDGVFTAIDGGVDNIASLIDQSTKRLRFVKEIINTSDYEENGSGFLEEVSLPYSKPWAIQLDDRPAKDDIRHFEGNVEASNLEFSVVHFDSYLDSRGFDAELMDKNNYGKTAVRTKEDAIRIYPREDTGIDQSFRIYNFVDDHIEADPEAVEVV
jgi:predicted small metal-binding protein